MRERLETRESRGMEKRSTVPPSQGFKGNFCNKTGTVDSQGIWLASRMTARIKRTLRRPGALQSRVRGREANRGGSEKLTDHAHSPALITIT